MNQHTDTWDLMIIYILVHKLDNKTTSEWELHISNKELPTLQQLYSFWSIGVMPWKVCHLDRKQMN